ncbi:S8 family serine peptidase [Desulfobacula toluolica]|uniref:Putative protease family S8 and S53 protein n=1 Tax=Desulfobacula toluolica (strain DSM 7467 / Tol2) TaxID=651182 RepID=K0NG78_DESTT|nr:S8 family serine peptidase [Desulfobacula toluolica]CCK78803.1 putative protease family S8 and S53 protein [Desulfobacula toluolica Tol2]
MNPDIAIIDSGVNPHHFHVQTVSGGHGYGVNSKGQIEKTRDFKDEIGHGTAICGIIRQKAPFADLYAIKIFHRDLTASASSLIEALKWAIDKPFKIIHLSLGVENEALAQNLKPLCQKAHDRNILILASARGPEDRIFPAFFQTVIGVYWNHDCDKDQMVFHPESKIEFGAHGLPRAIPGMPQEQNFRGNSFAVAHVTAKAAQLMKHHPDKNIFQIKKQLAASAKTI